MVVNIHFRVDNQWDLFVISQSL